MTSDVGYDAFGAVRSGDVGGFGFAGEQTDSTGLVHLRAHQYDPTLGRFLSTDGVQPGGRGTGGWNLYSYVTNNPTTATDPSGEASLFEYAKLASHRVVAFQLRLRSTPFGIWALRESVGSVSAGIGWGLRHVMWWK